MAYSLPEGALLPGQSSAYRLAHQGRNRVSADSKRKATRTLPQLHGLAQKHVVAFPPRFSQRNEKLGKSRARQTSGWAKKKSTLLTSREKNVFNKCLKSRNPQMRVSACLARKPTLSALVRLKAHRLQAIAIQNQRLRSSGTIKCQSASQMPAQHRD